MRKKTFCNVRHGVLPTVNSAELRRVKARHSERCVEEFARSESAAKVGVRLDAAYILSIVLNDLVEEVKEIAGQYGLFVYDKKKSASDAVLLSKRLRELYAVDDDDPMRRKDMNSKYDIITNMLEMVLGEHGVKSDPTLGDERKGLNNLCEIMAATAAMYADDRERVEGMFREMYRMGAGDAMVQLYHEYAGEIKEVGR